MLRLTAALIAYCLPVLGAGLTPANASEWGCHVLLCAASDNPSWQSVPSCHPPMYKLIACKFKTFGACPWPTCPEGGTGEPGYQKFEDCPEGWRPAATPARDGFLTELNLCIQTRQNCESGVGLGDARNLRSCVVSMPRPVRAKPYYFEMTDSETNQVERHWFSLKK
jgi:hypothetical protein